MKNNFNRRCLLIIAILICSVMVSGNINAQTKVSNQILLEENDFVSYINQDGKIIKELKPGKIITSNYALYNGEEYIVYLYNNHHKGVTTSKDGVNWTQIDYNNGGIDPYKYPDGVHVVKDVYFNDNYKLISYDGKNWKYYDNYSLENALQYEQFSLIYWNGSSYIASTNKSRILISSDMKEWKDTNKKGWLTSIFKDSKSGNYFASGYSYYTGETISGVAPALFKSSDGLSFNTVKVMDLQTEFIQYNGTRFSNERVDVSESNSEIYYKEGVYYALCSGWGLTSVDSKVWQLGKTDFPKPFLYQRDGITIASPTDGKIRINQNGTQWIETDFSHNNFFQCIYDGASNGSRSVLMGDSEIYISQDYNSWVIKSFEGLELSEIAYIEGVFYLFGRSLKDYSKLITYTSMDGMNWTNDNNGFNFNDFYFNHFLKLDNKYVLCDASTKNVSIHYSDDGIQWQNVEIAGMGYVASSQIDLNENRFLVKGDLILRLNWARPIVTNDYVNWTEGYYGDGNHAQIGFVIDDEFVVLLENGKWIRSINGVNWFETTDEEWGIENKVSFTGHQKYYLKNNETLVIYDQRGVQTLNRSKRVNMDGYDPRFIPIGQTNTKKEMLIYGDGSIYPHSIGGFILIIDPIRVKLDGQILWEMDEYPYISQGRTMIPLRGIFQKMGADVSWNNETETALLILDDNRISITKDSEIATVNGKEIIMSVKPEIISGRLYIPLRFVAESLGATVDWDDVTNSVIIWTQAEQ